MAIDEIDGLVVRLGKIDKPPQRRLREQFALRIGLERNRDFFRAVAEAAQLAHQTADMPLGAAVDERHVRFTHKNGTTAGIEAECGRPDYIIAVTTITLCYHPKNRPQWSNSRDARWVSARCTAS